MLHIVVETGHFPVHQFLTDSDPLTRIQPFGVRFYPKIPALVHEPDEPPAEAQRPTSEVQQVVVWEKTAVEQRHESFSANGFELVYGPAGKIDFCHKSLGNLNQLVLLLLIVHHCLNLAIAFMDDSVLDPVDLQGAMLA